MQFSLALVTLLAGWAVASPAAVNNLDARVDCSTCRCSSVESCTFDVMLPVNGEVIAVVYALGGGLKGGEDSM
ncbi:hypothetical protein GQ53DRAFT_821010 [Thozetella sp. PMI_491]|nr:hypothetical protein GQ53DRAFT_821010 [Thozetella sp. PMI_491]